MSQFNVGVEYEGKFYNVSFDGITLEPLWVFDHQMVPVQGPVSVYVKREFFNIDSSILTGIVHDHLSYDPVYSEPWGV